MTIKKIRKRDGSVVLFQKEKIVEAIWKAVKAVGGQNRQRTEQIANIVIEKLEKKYSEFGIPEVEEVQDLVEKVLIEEGHAKVAKAYILYRKSHEELRNVKGLFDTIEVIDDYVGLNDWMVKENSNMGFSLQGLNNYIADKIIKNYWMRRIYPEAIRKAHENVEMHIHDLGCLAAYCVGWDLKDLLLTGFKGVVGKVESKPAKHFRTALGQVVNFFYTLQGESAGAQAFSNFDTLLAPFIRYDALDYKEVKQAMQEFLFNLAVPTRVGFQSPFTNITMDLKVPEHMKNEPVIIGGQAQKEKYSEFQEEMDVLNRAFAECMILGDASGRVFTFPIPTYNVTKDFDWNNKNYDLIWEMTAKYGIPYFSNFINSDMKPEDARSMCLHGDEEIIVRVNSKIQRTTMKDLVETYGGNSWNECKENIEAIALDENYRVKWERIKNFLKIQKQGMRIIKTRDGKFSRFSLNHPILILQKEGFGIKFAKDVQLGDYMLSIKSAEGILSKEKQYIGNYEFDDNMAFLLGFFTADGNYLYRAGKTKLRGLQFTFNSRNTVLIGRIKAMIKSVFNYAAKEKKDPRYNNYYLYIYNSNLAELIYNSGFVKYGRLPNIIFNSSKNIIESFLEGFFCGDGYEKRKEIHISDNLLIRDLTILYSLLGISNILKIRKKSQILYLQHKKSAQNKINQPVNCINELIPGFFASSTSLVPGLTRNRMIGQSTLQKYNAETEISKMILSSNIYPVRVTEIIDKDNIEDFYDIELEKNHKFVHSLGTITNNCCRLRLNQAELRKRGGGLFGSYPLTGSLGVVTINMPRLGFISANEEEYFKRLGELMELAKESLEIKRKTIEKFTEIGLYPYSKFYLRSIKQRFGEYWKNHFSTIGLLGMNESIMNFMPGENIITPKGRDFTLRVLDFMRSKLEEYQTETGNIYNLEATPGEGTTYRFAREDKKKFGRIIVANEEAVKNGGKPFYTNSTHIPVDYTDDLFEALELQDELQIRYSGGTVFHGFIGEKLEKNGVKNLVRKIAKNFHLPYFTLTPTFSICPIHGYLSGEHKYCPKCDEEIGYKNITQNANRAEVIKAVGVRYINDI